MRIVCIALIVALHFMSIDAQFDPVKVGDYQSSSDDYQRIAKEVRSFVERLAKEPKSTRGAIALINGMKSLGPCVDNRWVEDKSFEESIRASIPRKYRKRITFLPSESVSIRGIAEFYFVPDRASLPRTIERIAHPPCCCSEISIERSSEVGVGSKTAKFTLVLPVESERTPPNPMWTVSAGRILSGQGTKSIQVGFETEVSTITVEVAITPPNATCGCPSTASYTTRVRVE